MRKGGRERERESESESERERERERVQDGFEDAMLLPLKMEEGATLKNTVASRRWKRQGNGSPTRAS